MSNCVASLCIKHKEAFSCSGSISLPTLIGWIQTRGIESSFGLEDESYQSQEKEFTVILSMQRRRKLWTGLAAVWGAAFLMTVMTGFLWMGSGGRTAGGQAGQESALAGGATSFRYLADSKPTIPVYLAGEKRVESVPLELYVRGVVAAEMPIEFELEALKAQAIAARTYIIHRLLKEDQNLGTEGDARITNTVNHQVYLSEEELAGKWDKQIRDENLAKLNRAIVETAGRILVYDGEPIDAVFFSTSNGYTDNSEEYWAVSIPYLRSVPSPWDISLSPRYKETIVLTADELVRKLGLPNKMDGIEAVKNSRIVERTEGGRIKTILVGGQRMTGREVREKLQLNSSDFEWKVRDGKIEITTYGYGHGIGMSQWGAQGMALEGKTAESILRYFYQGVEMGLVSDYIN